MSVKQVIVVRKDLLKGEHSIRKGKLAGQVAHASVGAMMKYFKRTVEGPTEHHPNASYLTYSWRGNATSALGEWLEHDFTKIVVGVEDEAELLKIKEKCDEIGVVNALITDNGWTEFHGVPTITCLGIGPTDSLILDQITGDLKLI